MASCSSSTFDSLLLNQQFRSYASLMEAFARYETNNLVIFFRYQEESKVVFVIITSKQCDNRALRYSKLYFGWYKRKRKSTASRGCGEFSMLKLFSIYSVVHVILIAPQEYVLSKGRML